jgi:PilZ domain-containing protein
MVEPETIPPHQTTLAWGYPELRASTRFAMGSAVYCQVLCGEPPRLLDARVADLSPSGIGLVLPCPLAPDGVTAVQLTPGPFLSARAVVARVVYCLPLADGAFQVGAEFDHRLSGEELRVLLS